MAALVGIGTMKQSLGILIGEMGRKRRCDPDIAQSEEFHEFPVITLRFGEQFAGIDENDRRMIVDGGNHVEERGRLYSKGR